MRHHKNLRTRFLGAADFVSGLFVKTGHEQGALLSFMFHGLFENSREFELGLLDPQQGITAPMFRTFVSHFLELGYRFVSPAAITEGLPETGKFVLATFDDGYFNNVRVLPVLQEFDIPAVFFISTNHVKHGKAFWWDVVFREGKRRYRSDRDIERMVAHYKQFRTDEIEADLKDKFGPEALRPASDLDRPLSAQELQEFSQHKQIIIGNHTRDHAILTQYSELDMQEQIIGGQTDIQELTGQIPTIIAYPNGNESEKIRNVAGLAGLRLGMGVRPGKNQLPLTVTGLAPATLRRFTLWGNRNIEQQCRASRSAISILGPLRAMRHPIRATALSR
jgi:peptidoglycan/xylan/chitin deacetylase (PgdA/CDA1 family)